MIPNFNTLKANSKYTLNKHNERLALKEMFTRWKNTYTNKWLEDDIIDHYVEIMEEVISEKEIDKDLNEILASKPFMVLVK